MKFFQRRGLMRSERGATAVEFGILLPLFLSFILGIFDICAYFFVAGQLQYGVEQASRSIRVGDATVTGNTTAKAAAFRDLVCDNIYTFMINNCKSNVKVDVRSFSSFDVISYPVNQDTNSNGIIDDTEVSYCAGEPSSAVVARAYFNYSTIVPALAVLFTSVVPGTITISSSTTFRTEPYNGVVTCP